MLLQCVNIFFCKYQLQVLTQNICWMLNMLLIWGKCWKKTLIAEKGYMYKTVPKKMTKTFPA